MTHWAGATAPAWIARIAGWAAAALFLLPVLARAQGLPPPPTPLNLDERGINVTTGQPVVPSVSVSIGPQDHHGLQFTRQWVKPGWGVGALPTLTGSTSSPTIAFQGRSVPFTGGPSSYTPVYQDGSTLVHSGSSYTYTSSDGTIITFGDANGVNAGTGAVDIGFASQITWPDGTIWAFAWDVTSSQVGWTAQCNPYGQCVPAPLYAYFARLSSIENTAGYKIKVGYAAYSSNIPEWLTITGATAMNKAVEICDPYAGSCVNSWPQISYSGNTSMTDPAGRTTNFTYGSGTGLLTAIRAPGATSDTINYEYNANNKISIVTASGSTWNYNYGTNSDGTSYTTVTGPMSSSTTYNYNTSGQLTTVVAGGRTTYYYYCTTGCPVGLVQWVTAPEGNRVSYTYDARGNVTMTTHMAKPLTGLSPITTSASYLSVAPTRRPVTSPHPPPMRAARSPAIAMTRRPAR